MADFSNPDEEEFFNSLPKDIFVQSTIIETNQKHIKENQFNEDDSIRPFPNPNTNSNYLDFTHEEEEENEEDFILDESDIKNNFLASSENKKLENNEFLQKEHYENPFELLRKKMFSNTNPIPRVPSYPIPFHSLSSKAFNDINNDDNNSNSTYFSSNLSNNNLYYNNKAFCLPNDSFEMNGKNGWICNLCRNFNYESKKSIYNYFLYSENKM